MSAFMGLPATPEQAQGETEVLTEYHALARRLSARQFDEAFAAIFGPHDAVPGGTDLGEVA